ncbi:hypothetical protein [Plastoroseomonas hellenica]|uniref:hypothetical protein n=1 Tax=Plastoroseomonas hellenica TaxID=2687306 RepID=UPI001BAB2C2C|nr:hypothetical protein [Plastoroseomonas hellenica]
MSQFSVQLLLDTEAAAIRDVACGGECRHRSAEECASATHLVFPYRGIYVRHVGRSDAVAEANQMLFFNKAEAYRVSHPVAGGDASLTLAVKEPLRRSWRRRSSSCRARGRSSAGCAVASTRAPRRSRRCCGTACSVRSPKPSRLRPWR